MIAVQQHLQPLHVRMLRTMANALSAEPTGIEFTNPDPVDWILKHFRIPETTDHHMPLGDYQVRALREALSRDEKGLFNYSLVVWSDIKKSAKSTVTAAVASWMAFNSPWGSIKIIANDLKQADSRVAYYIRRCIELNPDMRAICKVRASGYTIDLPNHCRIEAIPIDPGGEAGGNDTFVVYSELWAAKSVAAKQMWSETTLSSTLYGKSMRWVETYAGHSGEAPILEGLYESGVKQGNRISWSSELNPPLDAFENSSARIFCMWNQTPRLSWQTPEYYSQEAAVLEPSEFRRIHHNEWTSSVDSFVPIEWWDACRDTIAPLDADTPVVMALDAAVEGDCFGITLTGGRNSTGIYEVRFARKWAPPAGGKIMFRSTEKDGPEDTIRWLIDHHYVIEICYDPYQLADMAQRLEIDLIAHMHQFNQGKDRLVADKAFHDKIRERKIRHDGNAEVREHISNANRKIEADNKLRIIKRSQTLKIDLAVCLSMGTARAEYWQL